jgi:hypothetical protein
MPETIKSWGDWNAPAERMTSLVAFSTKLFVLPYDDASTWEDELKNQQAPSP